MMINRRWMGLSCSLLCVLSFAASAAPDADDGVGLLYMLCEPFGAYGVNLWNNFERLGWDVIPAGTHTLIQRCNTMTTDVTAEVIVDGPVALDGYDILAIAPTKGTHRSVSNPAADLRESAAALGSIRQANEQGLTLYAGCSSFLALADAGVLEGMSVVRSSKYATECFQADANCSSGSKTQPPIVDENIVTGTNQRYFALEIPEFIQQSLDRLDTFDPALDLLRLSECGLASSDIEGAGAVTAANAYGTGLSDLAYDVCSFEDGFVVAGQTYGGAAGNADALVIRFGPDAKVIWARTLGGPGRDTARSICATTDGGLAVVGLTTSAGEGADDVLVFKLSSDGELLWKRTHGGAGVDAGFAICEAANGDLLITGMTHGEGIDFSAISLLRLDRGGAEMWSSVYDGALHERGHGVVEREDGSILVAGGSSSPTQSNYDMIYATFTSGGESEGVVRCGTGVYDIGEDVVLAANGDVVVVGSGDTGNSSGDPNNALISRITPDGQRLWLELQGERSSFDYGQGIVELASGDLVICGATTGYVTGRNDVWFFSLTEGGSDLWQQTFGADVDNEWANALCQIADGRVVSVGWTRSHGAGSHDVLVMILDPALMR